MKYRTRKPPHVVAYLKTGKKACRVLDYEDYCQMVEESNLVSEETWISGYGACIVAVNRLLKPKTIDTISLEDLPDQGRNGMEYEVMRRIVHSVVCELRDLKVREAMLRYYYMGQSQQEIADIIGYSQRGVSGLLKKGKKITLKILCKPIND